MRKRKFNPCALPSSDGSTHYLNVFTFIDSPKVGERYYFQQDSRIDGSTITKIQGHYNRQGFVSGDIDMYRQYNNNGKNYAVIDYADFKNVLLTLTSLTDTQTIVRLPLASFLSLPSVPLSLQAYTKNRKDIRLKNISTMRSFIEFTAAPVYKDFVVPISLYYEPR